MKKTYEKPEMNVETFDVEDVITVSGANPVQHLIDTVGGLMEQAVDMVNSLGQ